MFLSILQELLIETVGNNCDQLFYRGNTKQCGKSIIIPAGEEVRFDTYFNMFSAQLWRKYTIIDNLIFRAQLKGKGCLRVYGVKNSGQIEKIDNINYFSDNFFFLVKRIDHIVYESYDHFFIEIRSYHDTILCGGGFYTFTEPKRLINLACCFCTYRREKELKENIKRLIDGIIDNQLSTLFHKAEVFISDNGKTLSEDGFNNKYVHLFPNINYGGSAGFTRCLIEAKFGVKGNKPTHLILMDDDAAIYPFVVERTAALLRYIRDEYKNSIIGGALLSKQQPWMQIENGAMRKDQKNNLRGTEKDLREYSLLLNNQEEDVNYNGWFYCSIPTEYVTEDNLPLPLFIHGDDINYGVRNPYPIIRMNGICVWHPDPRVNVRPYMKYYDSRNYKIVDVCLDKELSAYKIGKNDFLNIVYYISQYRYEEALYRIKGAYDFLEGVDWLKKLDAEEKNKEIMKCFSYDTIDMSNKNHVQFSKRISKELHFKKSRWIKNLLLPSSKEQKVYENTIVWANMDNYRAKSYCVIDVSTGKGIVLRKSYKQFFKVLMKALKLWVIFAFNGKKQINTWRTRISELECLHFWKSYLGC